MTMTILYFYNKGKFHTKMDGVFVTSIYVALYRVHYMPILVYFICNYTYIEHSNALFF